MRRRLFAVVPAAGLSQRMGQHKLLLPFRGSTVIRRLLSVLDRPDIAETFVVIRDSDALLAAEIRLTTATIVSRPDDPPDMRESVVRALDAIRERHAPSPEDAWLLAPADHPLLDAGILETLLSRWPQTTSPILVPTHQNRRGHPTLFRWAVADEITQLPKHAGINRLLDLHRDRVEELPVASASILMDLDTPTDYNQLLSPSDNT